MSTLILLAHGAGAGQSSDFMQSWRSKLATHGDVVAFEYPYMRKEGRRPPDRLPRLIAAHQEAFAGAVASIRPRRVVFVGKSMGSRVGCHLANLLPAGSVDAVVCLGYPLKGAKSLRDEVLRALAVPVLFVQGTRDPLCPLDLLQAVRPAIPARNELHVVQGGDHSLQLRKKDRVALGTSQEEADAAAFVAVRAFLQSPAP